MVLTLCLMLFVAMSAYAVPKGKALVFDGAKIGKVTMDGTLHNKAAGKCKVCHTTGVFQKMKKGTVKISMKKIYAGEQCGICHNGSKAFKAKGNCKRCHKK